MADKIALPLKQAMALGELLCGTPLLRSYKYEPFKDHESSLTTRRGGHIELKYEFDNTVTHRIHPDGKIEEMG
jgi:hypothetical protein